MPVQNYSISNDVLECEFILDAGLFLTRLIDKRKGTALLMRKSLFCTIGGDWEIPFNKTEGERNQKGCDLNFSSYQRGTRLDLQVHLEDHALVWQVIGSGTQQLINIQFPFLAALSTASAGQENLPPIDLLDPYRSNNHLFRECDFPLPVIWTSGYGRTLTFLIHQSYGEPVYPPQQLWSESGVVKRVSSGKEILFSGELILHDGGIRASFDHFRTRIRQQFDLSQYQREDLTWDEDVILQHFTFLYGREILDLDTGIFNIDRLLDEGQDSFGGYDSLILWGTYPRMGVDERTQWDFYENYPGGRKGLRQLGERARQRGARIFIPYTPWDRSAELHGRTVLPDEVELARLVEDIEADGVYLDTMSAVGQNFREAFDKAKLGVAICCEGRAKGKVIETITSSWEQSQSRDWMQGNWSASEESMPAVDLWRFIFPEHRLFIVSRFATAQDRKRIIQRGFFNGMGWVVWQDIFGLVLSYTPQEALLLKKCRNILREHRRIVWGAHPTPLIPVLESGVYCNEFVGDGKRLWIFYNANPGEVHGPVLPIARRPDRRYFDMWNNTEIQWDGENGLPVLIEPYQCGAVVELPFSD